MKILLTNYHGFEEGGSQKSTFLLAKALQENGADTVIVSTKKYPKIKSEVFAPLLLPTVFFQKLSLAPFLKKVIKKQGVDLVLAQDRLTSFGAVIAAKEKKADAGVIFRDFWFSCTKSTCLKPDLEECKCSLTDIMKSNPLYRAPWEYYKIYSIRNNLHVLEDVKKIAVSSAVKKKLVENNLSETISVIPNIVEFKKAKNSFDVRKKFGIKGKIVLFVGRFTYEKGIFQLLNAAKNVLNENKDAMFLFVGDGPLMQQTINRAHELGIEKNVFFVGKVSFNQMTEYYSQSDLVVVPSFMESFGRTAVEGFAAKKPVIASRLGGLVDVVDDGENGFLVDPKKTKTWSELILKLLENERLSKRLGENGYKKTRSLFSSKVVAKKLLKEFEK